MILSEYFRYNIHGIMHLAACGINLTLGIFVILNNPKSKLNQSFFLLMISAFIWIMGFALMSLSRSIQGAYTWASFSYIFGVPFISPHVYVFSRLLRKKSIHVFLVYLGYALATLLMIPGVFYQTEFWNVVEFSWGRYNQVIWDLENIIYIALINLFMVFYGLMAMANFWKGMRESKNPVEKRQFRNIFIAFIFGYTGLTDFFVTWHFNTYPFGYISITVFNLIVAYTITKYKLMDINLMVKKISLIFLIYVFLGFLVIPIVMLAANKMKSLPADQLTPYIVVLSILMGAIFSLGPMIYAVLLKRDYWLRGNLSKGFTHELKSPLMNIQGAIEIMKDNPGSDKNSVYVEMIDKNAQRLTAFVSNLLSVAKIQEDAPDIIKEMIYVDEVVHSIESQLAASMQKKNIEFVKDIQVDKPLWADPEKFQQVISNVISNAVKFTENGRVQFACHIEDGSAVFSVTDEGIGLRKDELKKVFNRFYQSSGVNKGSGIGLSIAKGWVEAHGGKIWAESEGEGKGTAVMFTLPVNLV